MSFAAITRQLDELADADIAEHSQRFFKTGPGDYGYGDKFIGVRVPVLRKLARQHRELTERDLLRLLKSTIHERRLLALLILVEQYQRADDQRQQAIYELYLAHTRWVNNWDLVDSSAHHIVGHHLHRRSKRPLTQLARSDSLWERRIAMIATFYFIRTNELDETFRLAKHLLHDKHDLMHKAVGWMLREAGKRDQAALESFLKQHYCQMPRTMLRYAIERFPETRRQKYLTAKI